MTAATPRVRVVYDADEAQFVTTCWGCHKKLPRRRILLSGALADAHRHAQRCDSIRLAALLARLEGLRNGWAAVAERGTKITEFYRGFDTAHGDCADELDVIIREAKR